MPRFTRNSRVGTLVSFALIAAGLAGTTVDNNGRIAGARTIAIVVVAMGALLSATNVFKATDEDTLSRALNYGAWYGFLLIAVSTVGVSIAAAGRWLRSKPTRS